MPPKHNDDSIVPSLARALELTEEALGQVARIGIEEIRSGLESSNHVQAAERDIRSALRQLVLAERELHARRPPVRASIGERAEGIARATNEQGRTRPNLPRPGD